MNNDHKQNSTLDRYILKLKNDLMSLWYFDRRFNCDCLNTVVSISLNISVYFLGMENV